MLCAGVGVGISVGVGVGVDKAFMNIALALLGSQAGGPAKVSVVSSALFGTMSGRVISNVITTGSFTIPAMKRTGYSPTFAAAVESVASAGGNFMPPVMGTVAFLRRGAHITLPSSQHCKQFRVRFRQCSGPDLDFSKADSDHGWPLGFAVIVALQVNFGMNSLPFAPAQYVS